MVITSDQAVRGGKIIELKNTVDLAVQKCPGVKNVFVAQRTGNKVAMSDMDVALEEVITTMAYFPQVISEGNENILSSYPFFTQSCCFSLCLKVGIWDNIELNGPLASYNSRGFPTLFLH